MNAMRSPADTENEMLSTATILCISGEKRFFSQPSETLFTGKEKVFDDGILIHLFNHSRKKPLFLV